MALCAAGVEAAKKKRTLRSVVAAHESAGGAPKTAGPESSVKKRISNSSQKRQEEERGREIQTGKGWGARLSRRCTVTETLLQTEPVQRRGIERCPKSIYSLNTDDTGKWLLESNHTPAKKRTTTKTEIK